MLYFVYICSPYGGLRENAVRAREYGQAVAKEGYIPVIPHVMWHGIFKDSDPEQRSQAMEAGLELLKHCNQLRVFGKDITPGMAQEINYARAHGIPVVQGQACTVNDVGDLFRFFESNFMYINRTVIDILNDYMEQGMTAELIKEAIKQTAKKNAGISYMETILNCWVGQKIFTIEKLREIKRQKKTDKQNDFAAYDMEHINKILENS